MPPKPSGVMAAPNQLQLTARIVSVKASEPFPDKQELELLLLDAKSVEGPDFATRRLGQTCKGFTFERSVQLMEGTVIRARAEYIGGPQNGQFQLTDLELDSD